MKPIIGISCGLGQAIYSLTQENVPQLQHRLGDSYVQAVLQAGGIPVILPNVSDPEMIPELVESLDGILLSGGGDVDPALFGQRAGASLGTVTPRRDDFELSLARYVLQETQKPVLGICRGIQVMNVAAGGTLYVDLPEAGKDCHSLTMYPRNVRTHEIRVLPGSRVEGWMGESRRVNSFHHQAVDALGVGFQATAWSLSDEVVEAMELPGDRFAVGVQWHPEELREYPEAKALFAAFVAAASE